MVSWLNCAAAPPASSFSLGRPSIRKPVLLARSPRMGVALSLLASAWGEMTTRGARGGRIRLQQRQFGGDVHDFLDSTDFELQVERKSAIDGDVQIFDGVCG